MRQNYYGAANRAHEGTNIQSMDIQEEHMSFSLVFRRKGVQYPKVMMISRIAAVSEHALFKDFNCHFKNAFEIK